jgi:hypothetical protein
MIENSRALMLRAESEEKSSSDESAPSQQAAGWALTHENKGDLRV